MFENLSLNEMLPALAGGFATYKAVTHEDYLAAVAIGLPHVIAFSKAAESSSTLGSPDAAQNATINISNFDLKEILMIVGVLYGSWRLYAEHHDATAAVCGAASSIIMLTEAAKSQAFL